MKTKLSFIVTIGLCYFTVFSCDALLNSNNTSETNVLYASNVVVVSENIVSNTTWYTDKVYYIADTISVSNGATLTVQPGSIVKLSAQASLVIEEGATISAQAPKQNQSISPL